MIYPCDGANKGFNFMLLNYFNEMAKSLYVMLDFKEGRLKTQCWLISII
jgi:hypothetical protein